MDLPHANSEDLDQTANAQSGLSPRFSSTQGVAQTYIHITKINNCVLAELVYRLV